MRRDLWEALLWQAAAVGLHASATPLATVRRWVSSKNGRLMAVLPFAPLVDAVLAREMLDGVAAGNEMWLEAARVLAYLSAWGRQDPSYGKAVKLVLGDFRLNTSVTGLPREGGARYLKLAHTLARHMQGTVFTARSPNTWI